ncbi:malate dehydrogenase, partial [Thioclava sp. BHET1]
ARSAKREAKILVVGNPANTNALILAQNAPSMPASAITAMLRLDHNRAKAMLAAKLDVPVAAIEKLAVWGNHSPTMFADVANATAAGKAIAADLDQSWYRETFIPKVAQRGTAIIEARGASSAASAANAALDHMFDWVHGSNGKWVSMGIASPGLYGIPEGLISGFPVICK